MAALRSAPRQPADFGLSSSSTSAENFMAFTRSIQLPHQLTFLRNLLPLSTYNNVKVVVNKIMVLKHTAKERFADGLAAGAAAKSLCARSTGEFATRARPTAARRTPTNIDRLLRLCALLASAAMRAITTTHTHKAAGFIKHKVGILHRTCTVVRTPLQSTYQIECSHDDSSTLGPECPPARRRRSWRRRAWVCAV